MKSDRALEHFFEVLPLLILVEVVDDALKLHGYVLVDDLLMLVLRHNDFVDLIALLILDEYVSLVELGLLVDHNESRLDRLLEPHVRRLESHLSVLSGSCKVAHRSLSGVAAYLRARSLHHIEHLFHTNELTSGLIKLHAYFLEITGGSCTFSAFSIECKHFIVILFIDSDKCLLQMRLGREAVETVQVLIGCLNLTIVADLLSTTGFFARVHGVWADMFARFTLLECA